MMGRTFCLFSCTIAISSIRPLGGPSSSSGYRISHRSESKPATPAHIYLGVTWGWDILRACFSEILAAGRQTISMMRSIYTCPRHIRRESRARQEWWQHKSVIHAREISLCHSTQLRNRFQPKHQVISKQHLIYNQSSYSDWRPIANTNSDHTLSTTYQQTLANS